MQRCTTVGSNVKLMTSADADADANISFWTVVDADVDVYYDILALLINKAKLISQLYSN